MPTFPASVPPAGWTTDALLTREKDGDTARLVVWRFLDGRFLDCWAPETHHTAIEGEKERGKQSLAYALEELLAREAPVERVVLEGHPCRIQIPASPRLLLGDSTTMGRFLVHLWLPTGTELAAEMVSAGEAELTKAELVKRLKEQ